MVKPTTRMAPALRPEDLKKGHGYGLDAESIRREVLSHLAYTLAELPEHVDTEREPHLSLPLTVHDRLIERWVRTQEAYYAHDAKRVYYLSLEFLMGRTLASGPARSGAAAPPADHL